MTVWQLLPEGVPDDFAELSQILERTVLMFVLKDDCWTQKGCAKALTSLLPLIYHTQLFVMH